MFESAWIDSQRSYACARLFATRSACFRMPADSDFFPKIPRKAMRPASLRRRVLALAVRAAAPWLSAFTPELPNQHGSQHDLIVERMYLEADHPATVLLDE